MDNIDIKMELNDEHDNVMLSDNDDQDFDFDIKHEEIEDTLSPIEEIIVESLPSAVKLEDTNTDENDPLITSAMQLDLGNKPATTSKENGSDKHKTMIVISYYIQKNPE